MAKNTVETTALQVAKTCINAVEQEKHFAILQEMHGFDGIINFSQTMKDLILLDQMDIFGISKEMQVILKHINQLGMLSHMVTVCKCFQREYEKFHQRSVVVILIGKESDSNVTQIVEDLRAGFEGNYDFIFKKSSTAGVVVRFEGKIIEYTANSVGKLLKTA